VLPHLQGFFLQTFVVKRLGYLFVIIAFALLFAALTVKKVRSPPRMRCALQSELVQPYRPRLSSSCQARLF
jgi:hypothetical protein